MCRSSVGLLMIDGIRGGGLVGGERWRRQTKKVAVSQWRGWVNCDSSSRDLTRVAARQHDRRVGSG